MAIARKARMEIICGEIDSATMGDDFIEDTERSWERSLNKS
jgi:hypothetical protein